MSKIRKSVTFTLFAIVFAAGLLFSSTAWSSGGIDPTDPMVRVTSPPVNFDVQKVLASVSKDVSKTTGIKESFITYFWQTFDNIVYEGKETDKPLFVDLYVPGFFSDDDVHGMLNAIADAMVNHAGIDRQWLFIHTHFPLPEQVYIAGGVTRWDQYRGKPSAAPRDIKERALNKFQFNDASFVFQCLWRFGVIAAGGSDLGELLTITSRIEDYDKESWYDSWEAMASKLRALGARFASSNHAISAKETYLRATNYYRASEIYLPKDDPRKHLAWEKGRACFLKAAELSESRIEPIRIPYEKTTLPGYFILLENLYASLSGSQQEMASEGEGTGERIKEISTPVVSRNERNQLVHEKRSQGRRTGAGKIGEGEVFADHGNDFGFADIV